MDRSLLALLLVVLTATGLAGCATRENPDDLDVAAVPLEYDEAMLVRDWPRTTTHYLGGGVQAGPSYYPLAPAGLAEEDKGDENIARLTDGLFFLVNTAILPVQLILDPPVMRETYRPGDVAPTFHAVPPMDRRVETPTPVVVVAEAEAAPTTRPDESVVQPKEEPEVESPVEETTRPTTRVFLPAK
ncbi:MAG: hypothetical protein AAF561_09550 [Planctomycetota bacterium]